MESRRLLNVVVRESTPVLKLLTGEDKTLLIRGNALVVPNFRLGVVDGVRRLDVVDGVR